MNRHSCVAGRSFLFVGRVFALLAATLIACGGGTTGPWGSLRGATPALQYTSAYSRFTYWSAEPGWIQTARRTPGVLRILADLGASSMPQVQVTDYASATAVAEPVRRIVGDIPSFASGLVTSARSIHLVSTAGGSGRDRGMTTRPARARALRVAALQSGDCEQSAVAAGDAAPPHRDRPAPRRLAAVLAGPQPTLAQLNAFDNTAIYESASPSASSSWSAAGSRGCARYCGRMATPRGGPVPGPEQFIAAFLE